MRISIAFAIVTASFTAVSTLTTPAAATDKDQALKLCAANRNCGILPNRQGDKGLDLQIVQSDGTVDTVSCPSKGPCTVVHRPKDGKGRTIGVKGANPAAAISGTPFKRGTAGGKIRPVATTGKAGVKADGRAAKTPPAKAIKRDHRGERPNAHPVTFAGTRDGHDPGWGSYGKGKGTDATVRDHRH
jgi:hypothetical protein